VRKKREGGREEKRRVNKSIIKKTFIHMLVI
jgi:hypothetical protein